MIQKYLISGQTPSLTVLRIRNGVLLPHDICLHFEKQLTLDRMGQFISKMGLFSNEFKRSKFSKLWGVSAFKAALRSKADMKQAY